MRRQYLVCYDVSDPTRLRRVFKKMLGYGDPLQYSIFLCRLSQAEKLRMIEGVCEIIHQGEDRVMVVDLGAAKDTAEAGIEFYGVRPDVRLQEPTVYVV